MDKIKALFAQYKVPVIIGAIVLFLFGTRAGKKIWKPTRRRRVRRRPVMKVKTRTGNRRTVTRTKNTGRGYPAAGGGYVPFKYNKDGSIKKAQFVAGTLAAKRRMATLRRKK